MIKKIFSRKFFKTFTITLVVIFAAAAGGYAAFRALIQAPDLQDYVYVNINIPRPPQISDEGVVIINPGDSHTQRPAFGETNDDRLLPEVIRMTRRPNFYTVLVFGLDSTNNVDAIMVAAYDTVRQRIYTISIPRDTLVDAERNLRKPVAAYAAGRRDGGGHEGGVEQLKDDIQSLLGFRVDFYVMVRFDAFVRMVDAVGGVEIYVPFHMRYFDPCDDLDINIPPGLQVLDGENALHFVRFRQAYPGYRSVTDYQRMANQQLVLRTLFAEIMSPRTIVRIPEFIRIYSAHVRTDLTNRNKLYFADHALSIPTMQNFTLPTTGTSGAPRWYELPDRDGIIELVNRTVNPFNERITAEMLRIASLT